MLAGAIQLDPNVGFDVDLSAAIRDAIAGIGAPQSWLTPPEQALEAKQIEEVRQTALQAMESQG